MRKQKIIIIDNDSNFSDANKGALEQAGFEVFLALDGKSGMERIRTLAPDIAIIEAMLRDINGFTLCRNLKEDEKYAAIPIILISSMGKSKESGYIEHISQEHKADAFFEKPVGVSDLIAKISVLMSSARPEVKESRAKSKILLVDDDPDFLDATKQILLANKYDVVTANNGEEGIAKAKIENPDLIILDVIMPGKDGFTTCYELRKIPQTRPIPVIMLTAVGQQLSKPEYGQEIAIDHLADDYIDKPVEMQVLLKKIEKQLLFR
jgi:two-component system alkaline phosphatase synthesis response regulator PhoP